MQEQIQEKSEFATMATAEDACQRKLGDKAGKEG